MCFGEKKKGPVSRFVCCKRQKKIIQKKKKIARFRSPQNETEQRYRYHLYFFYSFTTPIGLRILCAAPSALRCQTSLLPEPETVGGGTLLAPLAEFSLFVFPAIRTARRLLVSSSWTDWGGRGAFAEAREFCEGCGVPGGGRGQWEGALAGFGLSGSVCSFPVR